MYEQLRCLFQKYHVKNVSFELLAVLDTYLYVVSSYRKRLDYITIKTNERGWFVTITADVTDNRRKKYVVQALVCGVEGDTVHVPYKMQETSFRATCIRKPSINVSEQ
jgi:hypothetical protein